MRKLEEKTIASGTTFRLSVAPMLDWTDRHCRFFHRLLSPHAVLYTEMITTGALLHGDKNRFLAFSKEEHPIALQLGGSEPKDLAECARIAEEYGYDEINLNCGCPSDRVQKGSFGACLMAEPKLVADCVAAMKAASAIPVTVKCRIGIDDSAEYDFLNDFVSAVSHAGCSHFIVHARKAWLKGLSPKENREIPPLRYDIAARIKQEYPSLTIDLNGGITSLDQIDLQMGNFDGFMIGREAYHNPWFMAEIENRFFGTPLPDRFEIARAMIPYIESRQEETGMPIHSATRHMLGLFNGIRGAKRWRQILSEQAHTTDSPRELIEFALKALSPGGRGLCDGDPRNDENG
jgi:tRNA-dihydrouridine synthase A